MGDDRPGEARPASFAPSTGLLPRYPGPDLTPPDPVAGAAGRLGWIEATVAAERRAAPGLVAELLRYPRELRHLIIANDPRYHRWGLFDLLRGYAQREEDRPASARYSAELALAVARQLGPGARAAALGALADAHGRLGDLGEAAWHFARAFTELETEGGGDDLLLRAHLLVGRARLAQQGGALRDAESDFEAAALLLDRLGNAGEAAHVRLELAAVVGPAAPGQALRLVEQAIPLLDEDDDPRIGFAAEHLRIWFTCDAGRGWVAAELLDRARPLYVKLRSALARVHRVWLEGRILLATGDPGEAVLPLLRAYYALRDLG